MEFADDVRQDQAEGDVRDEPVGRLDVSSITGAMAVAATAGDASRATRFNLHAKNLGLTYPQNQCSPTQMLGNIKSYFGENLEWAVVCRELHEDGSPHLHCAVRTKKKVHIRNAHALDMLSRDCEGNIKHGSYEAVRSLRKWLTYVIKDDEYVEHGIDIKSFLNKKGSKYAQAVDLIIKGGDLNQVFLEDPGTWARHYTELSRIRDKVMSNMHQSQTMSVGVLQSLVEDMSSVSQQVALWMQMSLKQNVYPRRSQQLYLQGAPMTGKSRLASILYRTMTCYVFPDDLKFEDWDDSTEVVVADEPGSYPLKFMNKFLSGEVMTLPGRYKKTYKRKNVPFIFLSNNSPDELYKEASLSHNPSYPNYQAFITRLLIIKVEGQDLHTLCTHLEQRLGLTGSI
jgi:hypothetical protein